MCSEVGLWFARRGARQLGIVARFWPSTKATVRLTAGSGAIKSALK